MCTIVTLTVVWGKGVTDRMGYRLFVVVLLANFVVYLNGQAPQVTLPNGSILKGLKKDVSGKNINNFFGVPFAEPPVGTLRFKQPLPKGKWDNVLDATKFAPTCMQQVYEGYYPPTNYSEDCLYLNIYIPGAFNPSNKKAVMVWIYGGGFTTGSTQWYNPTSLSIEGDVIVVSVNYRLGLFGFLSTEDDSARGNYGLWDQHLAIKWVKENIGVFGGDADKITIFGESAGGASVSYQVFSLKNKDMFQRAISHSGTVVSPWALQPNAKKSAFNAGKMFGCDTDKTSELVECLRSVDASKLANLTLDTPGFTFGFENPNRIYSGPVIDGEFILEPWWQTIMNANTSVQSQQILANYGKYDLISGFNDNEGGILLGQFIIFQLLGVFPSDFNIFEGVSKEYFEHFTAGFVRELYPQNQDAIISAIKQEYKTYEMNGMTKGQIAQTLFEMFGQATFEAPTVTASYVHDAAEGMGKTYMYNFRRELDVSPLAVIMNISMPSWYKGVNHADELLFLFDEALTSMNANFTGEQLQWAKNMRKYWSNFAKTGDPNSAGLPSWQAYNNSNYKYLEYGPQNITVKYGYNPSKMLLWTEFLPTLAALPTAKECEKEPDEDENDPMWPVVETMNGKLRGLHSKQDEKSWDVFLGVPFAQKPIGKWRFRAPVPASNWDGIRNATQFEHMCIAAFPDPTNTTTPPITDPTHINYKRFKQDEDCLYLNIIRPKGLGAMDKDKLAVMVFIHGGGFMLGSANTYDSRGLSWDGKVIVVLINYRLGPFGFLSTGDHYARGNFGLMDQMLALKWVKHNIGAFGGDSERITIFGESAGASSVLMHVMSPMSKGLFQRAIMQSHAVGMNFVMSEDNLMTTRLLANRLNCTTGSIHKMVECLREVDAMDFFGPEMWAPVIDGEVLPMKAAQWAKMMKGKELGVDIMLGANGDEGGYFAFSMTARLLKRFDLFTAGISREEFKTTVEELVKFWFGLAMPGDDQLRKAIAMGVGNLYTDWDNLNDPVNNMKELVEMVGDMGFVAPAVFAADAISQMKTDVFLYHYTYHDVNTPSSLLKSAFPNIAQPSWLGADHGNELNYVHGVYLVPGMLTPPNGTMADIQVSKMVISYWSNFARFGTPNGALSPVAWPKYDHDTQMHIEIDTMPEIESRMAADKATFLNQVVNNMMDDRKSSCSKPDMVLPQPPALNISLADFSEISMTTRLGKIHGFSFPDPIQDGLRMEGFIRIPYAKPPIGNLRFAKPVKMGVWESDLNATIMAPACPQKPSPFMQLVGLTDTSEDCLYLSIYRREPVANEAKKPVVISIHDGDFIQGTGNVDDLSGPVSLGNLIGVTFNYRLGALGFTSLGDDKLPGNLGLYDILMALDWVRDNIADYGGDPNQITVVGHGTGAIVAAMLMISPMTQTKIKRAMILDETYLYPYLYTKDKLVLTSRKLAAGVGCLQTDSEALLKCLRSKPEDQMIVPPDQTHSALMFYPVADSGFVSTDLSLWTSKKFAAIDLLVGNTEDYAGYFLSRFVPNLNLTEKEVNEVLNGFFSSTVPFVNSTTLSALVMQEYMSMHDRRQDARRNFESVKNLFSDQQFYSSAISFANSHKAIGGNTYVYRFSHRPSISIQPKNIGATYGDDGPFMIGMMFNKMWHQIIPQLKSMTDQEKYLSANMMNYLINFVKTGNPNTGKSVPATWPAFDMDKKQFMKLDTTIMADNVVDGRLGRKMRYWLEFIPGVISHMSDAGSAPRVTTKPTIKPTTTPCPEVIGSSDFFKSLSVTPDNAQSLVLGLIIATAVLGLLFLVSVGCACKFKSRLNRMKKEQGVSNKAFAAETGYNELTKM